MPEFLNSVVGHNKKRRERKEKENNDGACRKTKSLHVRS